VRGPRKGEQAERQASTRKQNSSVLFNPDDHEAKPRIPQATTWNSLPIIHSPGCHQINNSYLLHYHPTITVLPEGGRNVSLLYSLLGCPEETKCWRKTSSIPSRNTNDAEPALLSLGSQLCSGKAILTASVFISLAQCPGIAGAASLVENKSHKRARALPEPGKYLW
jgi:hypothetical protein